MGATRSRWVADMAQDLRFAFRSLAKNPGFALITALTIALGVAATTTVFSLMNGLLLRPLPVPQPERLFAVEERRDGSVSTDFGYGAIPYERFLAYREGTRSVFTGMAAQRVASFALRIGDDAIAVSGVRSSRNYFDVLGVRPAVGRFFTSDDESGVVLAHRVWLDRFGGDRSIVGKTVNLDSRPFTVVGVAPRGFSGTIVGVSTSVWVPIGAHNRGESANAYPWVFPIGRLRPGVDAAQAAAVVDVVAQRIPPERPHVRIFGAGLDPLTGMAGSFRPTVARFFTLLLATAALVLLIAAANIAGMLLARAVARRREVAIRLAIGAGRGRLIRQLLTESVLLFLLGAIPGVALTYLGTRLVQRIPVPISLPVEFDVAPDLRVLAFALAIAAATGIVFGLVPALHASRPDLVPALKGAAAGVRRTRGRSVFVAGQLAAAVMLLVAAGLFVRALQSGLATDLGFDPDNVVVATVDLAPHGYDEARGRAFYQQLAERVRALPGVEGVGLAAVTLVAGSISGNDVRTIEPGAAEPVRANAAHNRVDPGYFATLRIPLVAGRLIDGRDVPGAPRAAVVNESLAQRLWPGENPLGKRLSTAGEVLEVVGVARNGKYWQVGERPQNFVFHAFAQEYTPEMTLHVRSSVHAAEMLGQIRREVRALDANVAVERPASLPTVVGFSLLPQKIGAWLIGLFGLVGLALAAIGVYGVLSFQVAQRVREIGIRLALGASVRGVLGLVLRRGALLAVAGAGAGLIAAAAVTRLIERALFPGILFGVSPLDPLTFLAVPAVLIVVALLASYVPARRAARITPLEALRSE